MKELIRKMSCDEIEDIISNVKAFTRNLSFHKESVFNDISSKEIEEIEELNKKLELLSIKLKNK